jgi:hypothetical protein
MKIKIGYGDIEKMTSWVVMTLIAPPRLQLKLQ